MYFGEVAAGGGYDVLLMSLLADWTQLRKVSDHEAV